MGDPNVAHPHSFPSLRESVNTFSAHGFPPVHVHQHFTHLCCSLPQFVAELVCTLRHWTVTTYHTDYVQLAGVGVQVGHMQSMPCVDSPNVSEEPCAFAHTCTKLSFRCDTFHRSFYAHLVFYAFISQ